MVNQWHKIVRKHVELDAARVQRFQSFRKTLPKDSQKRGAQWLAFQLEFYDEPNQERIDF
jgi:hypothetical protein